LTRTRNTTSQSEFTGDVDSPELLAHVIAIRQLGRQTIDNVVAIGGRLTECKRIVGHGGWYSWLRREFDWSRQTADNLINVFEASKSLNFGDLNLPVSSLYMLATPSTPAEVSKAIIKRVKKGEKLTGTQIKAAVKGAAKRPAKKPKPAAANSADHSVAPSTPLTVAPAEQPKVADASADGIPDYSIPASQVMPGDIVPPLPDNDTDPANEIQRLNKVIIGLRSEIEDLQQEIEKIRRENVALKEMVAAWQSATDVEPRPGAKPH
jgi:hypothetical protein